MSDQVDPALVALLENRQWLERLARRLLTDPDLAEDAVQETMVLAITRPPREPIRLRAWLSRVLRSQAWLIRRSATRRLARERAAASPESVPSSEEMVEQLETQRRIIQIVHSLAEPYRHTLLLRYVADIEPGEIARRMGVPASTVRTRLQRAHEELRRRLAGEFGGRARWVLALTPFIPSREAAVCATAATSAIALGSSVLVMKKLAAIAALVLLLLASLAVTKPWETRTEQAQRAPAAARARVSETAAAVRPDRTRKSTTEILSAPNPPTSITTAVENPITSPSSAADDVMLQGTVVVIDEQGKEHPGESGELDCEFHEASRRHEHATVNQGRWQCPGPAGSELTIQTLVLGGRSAYVEPDSLPAAEGEVIAVRATWFPANRLRVVDSLTGADLTDVDVTARFDDQRGELDHPGEQYATMPFIVGAASPLEVNVPHLSASTRTRVCWARAPGHAWRRIELDLRSAGERVLELAHGGALEVHIMSEEPTADLILRVRRLQGEVTAEPVQTPPLVEAPPSPGGATLVPDLSPGAYEVTAEIGEWYGAAYSLGGARATVVAGETTRIELAPQARPPPSESFPLRGTLLVPAAWGEITSSLDITCLEVAGGELAAPRILAFPADMTRDDALSGDYYHWDAGSVPPGKYLCQLAPVGLVRILEVGATDPGEFDLAVPDPAEVHVRVVDAEVGALVTLDELCWGVNTELNRSRRIVNQATRDECHGSYTFLAPPGEIRLSTYNPQWIQQPEPSSFEVHAGMNQHVLRVRKSCGVRIILRDGDAVLPWDWLRFHMKVLRVDGEGTGTDWHGKDEGKYVQVPAPGSYDVTLDPIPEYEPVASLRVQVSAGMFTLIEVKLVRSRP